MQAGSARYLSQNDCALTMFASAWIKHLNLRNVALLVLTKHMTMTRTRRAAIAREMQAAGAVILR